MNLLSLPPASDASTFDFSTLANYVPPGASLIRPEHTILDGPSRCFKVVGSGLYAEGLYRDRGPLEFALRDKDGEPWLKGTWYNRDVINTLHDLCLFTASLSATSTSYQEGIAEMTAELAALGLPLPAVWFPVYGASYPGSRGFGAVIDGAFVVL